MSSGVGEMTPVSIKRRQELYSDASPAIVLVNDPNQTEDSPRRVAQTRVSMRS